MTARISLCTESRAFLPEGAGSGPHAPSSGTGEESRREAVPDGRQAAVRPRHRQQEPEPADDRGQGPRPASAPGPPPSHPPPSPAEGSVPPGKQA